MQRARLVGTRCWMRKANPIIHPGTCTFYGTANSNQMLMEIMGLHIPGSAFINPGDPMRDPLTQAAARRAAAIVAHGDSYIPMADIVDEKAIINAIIGLHATGGSTNHTIHLIAIARAAGILIDWDDFDDLAKVTPLLCRVYPNGPADVNHFHAAGGLSFVIRELLDAGLLHEDVQTVMGPGLRHYATEPLQQDGELVWKDAVGGERQSGCCPSGLRSFRGRWRAESARRQYRPFGDQGVRGEAGAPPGRCPGAGFREPG